MAVGTGIWREKHVLPSTKHFHGGGQCIEVILMRKATFLPSSVQVGNFNWNRNEMALLSINPAARNSSDIALFQ